MSGPLHTIQAEADRRLVAELRVFITALEHGTPAGWCSPDHSGMER